MIVGEDEVLLHGPVPITFVENAEDLRLNAVVTLFLEFLDQSGETTFLGAMIGIYQGRKRLSRGVDAHFALMRQSLSTRVDNASSRLCGDFAGTVIGVTVDDNYLGRILFENTVETIRDICLFIQRAYSYAHGQFRCICHASIPQQLRDCLAVLLNPGIKLTNPLFRADPRLPSQHLFSTADIAYVYSLITRAPVA